MAVNHDSVDRSVDFDISFVKCPRANRTSDDADSDGVIGIETHWNCTGQNLASAEMPVAT